MTTQTDTADMMINVTVWDDPLAAGGLDADSDDALVYLTPILGPYCDLAAASTGPLPHRRSDRADLDDQ